MADDSGAWCNICGHRGSFLFPEQGREGDLCGNCGSSGRQRALLLVLATWLGQRDRPVANWEACPDLHVFEASGRGAYPALLTEKVHYCSSEFRPNADRGQEPWQRFADLEHLAYADGSLHVVIAADVFEHVRRDELAFAEIARVLAPGGLLVFTVPYDAATFETLIRVRAEGDDDVLLMEPEYHGGGGRALAYRTYGRDLPGRLRGFGFSVGLWEISAAWHAIDRHPVFACVKGDYVDLGRFAGLTETPPPGMQAIPLYPNRLLLTLKTNRKMLRQLVYEIQARIGR